MYVEQSFDKFLLSVVLQHPRKRVRTRATDTKRRSADSAALRAIRTFLKQIICTTFDLITSYLFTGYLVTICFTLSGSSDQIFLLVLNLCTLFQSFFSCLHSVIRQSFQWAVTYEYKKHLRLGTSGLGCPKGRVGPSCCYVLLPVGFSPY